MNYIFNEKNKKSRKHSEPNGEIPCVSKLKSPFGERKEGKTYEEQRRCQRSEVGSRRSEVRGQRSDIGELANAKDGITLIALIITVIILLILAGTAISISINGGDLFGRSQNAVAQYNNRVAEEENKINEVWSLLNSMTGENDGDSKTLPAGWDSNKLSQTTKYVEGKITVDGEEKTIKAPIPKGYTASTISTEDDISEGLVIYQGTEAVTDLNITDAQTSRNQFVWIPVPDINSMVMCKDNNKNNDGTVCNLVRQNDGSLKCMTHHENDNGTELCGRCYDVTSSSCYIDGKNVCSYTMNFEQRTQLYSANSSNREPDIANNCDNDANSLYFETAGMAPGKRTALDFLNQLETDFKIMAESVATYGGFYVGRYEVGYDSSTYTSKKGQVVMNASQTGNKGANMWYGLYKHLRKASTQNDPLNSQMIWGCQYDQVIKFIGNEAQIGHTDRNLPGRNSSTDYRPSGVTQLDIMKNIYDLEGNYYEWTTQAYSTDYRRSRGSACYDVSNSDFRPVSFFTNYNPSYTGASYSSRAGLYL